VAPPPVEFVVAGEEPTIDDDIEDRVAFVAPKPTGFVAPQPPVPFSTGMITRIVRWFRGR
jgi:hypothetical protein